MGRRIASQVHKTVSRLLRGGYLKKPPAWFAAVTAYPPMPLPARASPNRDSLDDLPHRTLHHRIAHANKHLRVSRPKMEPIVYLEDKIRKQFFQDHPFEAFRARTLVESAAEVEPEHPIQGEDWKRLRQRGRNPSSEDAVQFVLNLHKFHEMPLSQAYNAAVTQFRALRAEHSVASRFAVLEAETYGAEFGPNEIELGFALEEEALKSWESREETDPNAIAARKKWKAVADKPPLEWTEGEEYVRKRKAGIRMDYTLSALKAAAPPPDPPVDPIGILTR